MPFEKLRYLLLQVRNPGDPMSSHEVDCFARALKGEPHQMQVIDLLAGVPTLKQLAGADVVLLGGSGDYSVARGGPWLPAALESMQELVEVSKPTFASCWGFQAMAKAMGGEVIHDMDRAELGTVRVHPAEAAASDPVFQALPDPVWVQMGHEDTVTELPDTAVRLAFSDRVNNQAFRLVDKPIYCTQFHPELNRDDLMVRLRRYPSYIQKISGVPIEEFERTSTHEAPESQALLTRFVETFFS